MALLISLLPEINCYKPKNCSLTFCYISLTLFSFVGNDDIQPVCLPLHGDKEAIRAGLTLKLTGWGLMGSSEGIINKETAG